MKHQYPLNQEFLVTFAINSRQEPWQLHQLEKIATGRYGLYDTIKNAGKEGLSDGEIAEALLDSLHSIYSDETYKHTTVSIINWWAI